MAPSYHASRRGSHQIAPAARPCARWPAAPRLARPAGRRWRCPRAPSCRGRRPPRRAARAGSRRRWCPGPARGAARRAPAAAGCRRPSRAGRPRRVADPGGDGLRGALHRLQRDVAGEAVGDHDVGVVPQQVTPFDVADEVDPVGRHQRGVRLDHVLGALLRLLADREQRHPRPADAEDGLAEGGSEVGELDQVAGPYLGVGADVEQQARRPLAAGDGELHGERRPAHAMKPPQGEQRRGHRRPGRAGAHERVRAARGDVGRRQHHRGAGIAADRGDRVVVVPDRTRGSDHLDSLGAVQGRELAGVAEHAHLDSVCSRGTGTRDNRLGPPLGPPAVEGDSCHGPTPRSRASRPRRSRTRLPRGPHTSRRPGRPGAEAAGCDTAGTR